MVILVADDDQDIRELVEFKLRQAGHEVLAATTGSEALAAAREHLPDLAVLDVMMPGMSGLDVCRELRADPQTMAIAVVMLTARARESDVSTGFDVGADDYVIKPFSPRLLMNRIDAVLARGRR